MEHPAPRVWRSILKSITPSSTTVLSTNQLPIYPDASILCRFPPVLSRLSKLHRETWTSILRSIVSNELVGREETTMYRLENTTKERIFLICLSSFRSGSLRGNNPSEIRSFEDT